MTDEQILKEVINKVVKNGLKEINGLPYNKECFYKPHKKFQQIAFENLAKELLRNNNYIKFIFSSEFAKIYWGENIPIREVGKGDKIVGYDIPKKGRLKYWQYYQHKMLDEIQAGRNLLKYLEKFL